MLPYSEKLAFPGGEILVLAIVVATPRSLRSRRRRSRCRRSRHTLPPQVLHHASAWCRGSGNAMGFQKSPKIIEYLEATYLRGVSCAQQLPPPSPSILPPSPLIKGIVLLCEWFDDF